MVIKMLLYGLNTSWDLTEQIWFQEKCTSGKQMFAINKMSPIQKKKKYLPETIVTRCSEKFRKISN